VQAAADFGGDEQVGDGGNCHGGCAVVNGEVVAG
jgi:hypothetical protein